MSVHPNACRTCGPPEIWLQGQDGRPSRFQGALSELNLDQRPECFALVFMDANRVNRCNTGRAELATRFSVPTFWWTQYCKRANGYFGSQDLPGAGNGNPGLMTWARFLIKHVRENDTYIWTKLNIMTYAPSPKNQIMLVFDATPPTKALLVDSLIDGRPNEEIDDLFWMYYRILNDVVGLHDDSIWGLRTRVRDVERFELSASTSSSSTNTADQAKEQPRYKPNYRSLHDLARHAIHIAETTSTTINTIGRISAAHEKYMNAANAGGQFLLSARIIQQRVQDRLLLYHQMVLGLQNRAVATKDRLHNEIQLSFNTVTQDDAATTIKISLIAQNDSNVMKKIASLTLLFLPATFVSAIFSTSFFNFNPEHKTWSVSGMFWVYWVFSIPATVLAILSWHLGLKLPTRDKEKTA